MKFKIRTDSDVLDCMSVERETEADALRFARLVIDERKSTLAVVSTSDGERLHMIHRTCCGCVYEDDYRTGFLAHTRKCASAK
jgi:hypothetical protein